MALTRPLELEGSESMASTRSRRVKPNALGQTNNRSDMIKNKILLICLPLILFFNCDNFMVGTTYTESYNQSYVPLNVGDIRQIIHAQDSTTILYHVFGKTYRKDSISVFCTEIKWGTNSRDTVCFLIRDGYYIGTELDTTNRNDIDLRINPFNEQKLAKLYPFNGETFIRTLGDQDSMYWTSRKESAIKTFCGEFEEVYSFTLCSNGEPFQLIKTYYAKGLGFIGTSVIHSSELSFRLSYVKVGSFIKGSLWPEKNFGGDCERIYIKELYKYLIY